jgi:DNA-directed RNA polymerase specialized sigma24 family protein
MSTRNVPPNGGGDPTLFRLLREGDPDAAQALYARYAKRLRALVDRRLGPDLSSRVDPDDIVQSVFRTFLRGVAERRYQVPEGQDLWGLLLVLALNKVRACGQFHRAAKRDVRLTRPLDGPDVPSDCVVAAAGADPFLHSLAQDLLQQFLPVHRQMIELRLEGYAVAEIAARTGRSRRTVERILQNCRASLLQLVDAHE